MQDVVIVAKDFGLQEDKAKEKELTKAKAKAAAERKKAEEEKVKRVSLEKAGDKEKIKAYFSALEKELPIITDKELFAKVKKIISEIENICK